MPPGPRDSYDVRELEIYIKCPARYRYEVTDSFIASPEDSWVMDRVRNEDLLTLQTCVGPNFSERLIVRAERV